MPIPFPDQLFDRVQIWPQLMAGHPSSRQLLELQNMFRRRNPLRIHPVQPLPHGRLRNFQGLRGRRLAAKQRHRTFKGSRTHMGVSYNPSCTTVNYSSRLMHNLALDTMRRMRETLGTRLKKARIDAGLTQEQLAKASGVSQQAISKIERGTQAVSSAVVPLARACGVSPEWLADGIAPRPTVTTGSGPPVQADPGSWLVQVIQILIANGVSPEEAIRLSNEAAQAAGKPGQKKGRRAGG